MATSIENEAKTHRDVILYDKMDEYDALPDKTFAGYQFFAQHCPQKQYVVFQDDDVFIKVNELKGQMNRLTPGKIVN